MRVVMVSKACVVGQYQTKLEELAQLPGVDLTVVVPPFWRDERGILLLERAHTRGYALIVAPLRFNGQFHIHYYPTLPRILRRVHPNIVHIDEEPYNLATFLALRAARAVKARTIFFTWQNILHRYPPPFAWLEAYVLGHADYAIAGNTEAANVLRAKNYRGPTCVIPQFGVDPTQFSPQSKDHGHVFLIGYAGGRLVEEKGIDVLLRAVAQLNGDWELHILGNGPAKPQLESLARDLKIAGRVHFNAAISSTAMAAFYHRLDALVLPSVTRPNWKEQFGRVLIEAMACEIPVIGSTCGEIPNVISDAGLVFPEGDADALRAHLITLQESPMQRFTLGKRGRERVLAHFTQASVAKETYEVYEELL
jgi:glycosyltransferase involved in cell wall biosynthesis